MKDMQKLIVRVHEQGPLFGVCSECQSQGIELIYEDEHTVLQHHYAFGEVCKGSYSIPETVYRSKEVK